MPVIHRPVLRASLLLAPLLPALLAPTATARAPSPAVLDRVEVTTRLPEDPRRRAEAVARLDARALDRIAPAHANEALARVPGAWASRGSGQEQLLALRSPVLTGPGACGAFLVLDDGVPIRPAGFCNVNQLSELNLAQAGRVEVLRGPGSAVHGSNALHGVVAVQPRRPGDGDTLRLETGSDAFRRLQVGLDGPHARLDAHRTEAGSFRADEGYRLVQATAQWQARDDTRLALSTHRLDQETAGFVIGDGAWRDARRRTNANPEAFRDARATRLVLHHEQTVGDATLLLRPYARDESQTFLQHFVLGQPLEENGSRSLGVQTLWQLGGWRAGIDVETAEGRLRQTQARPLASGTAAQIAIRPAGRHYDYTVAMRQAAVFAEHQWDAAGATWTAGTRLERLGYRHDNRMREGNTAEDGTPCGFGGCLYLRSGDRRDAFVGRGVQLGVMRPLDGGWSVGGRAARAFRFPQTTELYRLQRGQSVDGFRTERADSLEAVLRHAGPRLAVDATAYAMRKDDAILRDANGLSVPAASTRHRGVELAARWTPRADAWLEGQVAWSDQRYAFDRVLAGNEVIRRGARIDTAPEWLGGVRAGIERFGTTLEIEGVWQGAYWIDAANTRRYPGHGLWHLRAARPLRGGWTLDLRLMNLADRRYAERVDLAFGDVRSFPGAGRQVFLGLGWAGAGQADR